MKLKQMLAGLLAVWGLLALSGCQLALDNAAEPAGGDRLVGVFVTAEHLPFPEKTQGSAADEERLYAVRREPARAGAEFEFEGVAGIACIAATIPATAERDAYVTSAMAEGISGGKFAHSYGDEEDKTSLEGTIYLSPARAGRVCVVNPVYQGTDGRVYAVSGTGLGLDEAGMAGEPLTQTIEEIQTTTENGKSKSVCMEVKLSVAFMPPPAQITVLQMNDRHEIVRRQDYAPGKVPETLTPEGETAYLMTEARAEDGQTVTRELITQSDEGFSTFVCRADGVCVERQTKVLWPQP
ncbi:MAG: hypothetical protein EOM69_11445 [Clostridia bacterium]|nr:hypothetical protein [Clostridia bacterium]